MLVSSVDVAYAVDVIVVLLVSGIVSVVVVVVGSVVERVVLCVVLVVASVVVNSGYALIPTVLDRPKAANLGGAVIKK